MLSQLEEQLLSPPSESSPAIDTQGQGQEWTKFVTFIHPKQRHAFRSCYVGLLLLVSLLRVGIGIRSTPNGGIKANANAQNAKTTANAQASSHATTTTTSSQVSIVFTTLLRGQRVVDALSKTLHRVIASATQAVSHAATSLRPRKKNSSNATKQNSSQTLGNKFQSASLRGRPFQFQQWSVDHPHASASANANANANANADADVDNANAQFVGRTMVPPPLAALFVQLATVTKKWRVACGNKVGSVQWMVAPLVLFLWVGACKKLTTMCCPSSPQCAVQNTNAHPMPMLKPTAMAVAT